MHGIHTGSTWLECNLFGGVAGWGIRIQHCTFLLDHIFAALTPTERDQLTALLGKPLSAS